MTMLTWNTLRTAPVMYSERDDAPVARSGDGLQPLAYLYADWSPDTGEEVDPLEGFYDPDSQTWIQTGGDITAGHWTTSRPRDHNTIDDSCN